MNDPDYIGDPGYSSMPGNLFNDDDFHNRVRRRMKDTPSGEIGNEGAIRVLKFIQKVSLPVFLFSIIWYLGRWFVFSPSFLIDVNATLLIYSTFVLVPATILRFLLAWGLRDHNKRKQEENKAAEESKDIYNTFV